jgi:hypothetical protein
MRFRKIKKVETKSVEALGFHNAKIDHTITASGLIKIEVKGSHGRHVNHYRNDETFVPGMSFEDTARFYLAKYGLQDGGMSTKKRRY